MRKKFKRTYTNTVYKKSSKFKCYLYTWIWIRIRIQQLKLMRIHEDQIPIRTLIRTQVIDAVEKGNFKRILKCKTFLRA